MEVEDSNFDDNVEEEFYTKASVSLLNARKNIAMFSFKKASERLSKNESCEITTNIETLRQTYEGLLKMGPSVSQLGSRRPMSCIRFRPGGGKLLSGDWTGLVQVWNSESYNSERSLIGHTERVVSVNNYIDSCIEIYIYFNVDLFCISVHGIHRLVLEISLTMVRSLSQRGLIVLLIFGLKLLTNLYAL